VVDYRRLNANTGPLNTAVVNTAELISTIQEHGHLILATIDVKDMFFMLPFNPKIKPISLSPGRDSSTL